MHAQMDQNNKTKLLHFVLSLPAVFFIPQKKVFLSKQNTRSLQQKSFIGFKSKECHLVNWCHSCLCSCRVHCALEKRQTEKGQKNKTHIATDKHIRFIRRFLFLSFETRWTTAFLHCGGYRRQLFFCVDIWTIREENVSAIQLYPANQPL